MVALGRQRIGATPGVQFGERLGGAALGPVDIGLDQGLLVRVARRDRQGRGLQPFEIRPRLLGPAQLGQRQGALRQGHHLQAPPRDGQLGRGRSNAGQHPVGRIPGLGDARAKKAIPGQQVRIAVRRGHSVMQRREALGRLDLAQLGGRVGDVVDSLDLAHIEGVALVQPRGLGHVVKGAFLVADVRQRVAVNLMQFGQHRLGDPPALLKVAGQLSREARSLGPAPDLTQMPHALDARHQPHVRSGLVHEPPPVRVGECPEAARFVTVGHDLQGDQRLQRRVIVAPGRLSGLGRPGVEPALDLVALVGVEHAPQAEETRLSLLTQGAAAGPLNVLVVARRVADLVRPDLTAQLLKPLGQRRVGLRPGSAGREGPDQKEGRKKPPQIRVLELAAEPSWQVM